MQKLRILVFEFGYDVLVEKKGGDGGILTGEVFVEAGLLEVVPDVVHKYV